MTVTLPARDLHRLSDREYELLMHLAEATGPLTRTELMARMYGGVCAQNAIATLVPRLRRKLEGTGQTITHRPGFGYTLTPTHTS